ncbi:hypothetical protein M501DRAFT_396386 [Patellaria atrata CBS 101060]|uniref:Magnesium transporter n=1 Tax=Patellaria atrata CBS 101060 TaxID=1346257 RepID=A0A9P4SGC9_9PEZI|nr:hypothetical protein M501DRAFT_396386 [Patellaria atrata CBS 101060]
MGFTSNLFNLVGLVLLGHAVYSAHEHSSQNPLHLPSSPPSFSPLTTPTSTTSLPTDIVLETLFSVLLISTGIVLGSSSLRPIQWSKWAGQLEREERVKKSVKEIREGTGNPYRILEERPGFVDVRGKRKEFMEWVRKGDDLAAK